MKREFFFDTADELVIRKAWQGLGGEFEPEDIKGITTNPKALHKAGILTLKELEEAIPRLCGVVTELRDGQPGGEVYVQIPGSFSSIDTMLEWAKYVVRLGDGITKVSMKIPPYANVLDRASELADIIDLNVTGVADAAMALRALSFPSIKYVSVIPGRMEERGINATEHLRFLQKSWTRPSQKVITGSMRTLDGLARAIDAGTIPTIGGGVWDQITESTETVLAFRFYWNAATNDGDIIQTAPLVTQDCLDLSLEFFKEMNSFGTHMCAEFLNGFVEQPEDIC